MVLTQTGSGAKVTVEPVHSNDSTGNFLNKAAPDREQDLASFDLSGELLVYAKVRSFQLPSTILPLLLLLEMFEFGDNRTWYSGTRSPGSRVMDALESDVHHGEF